MSPSIISRKSNKSAVVKHKKGQLSTCITTSRIKKGSKGSRNRSVRMKTKSNHNLSCVSNDVSQKSAKKSAKKKTVAKKEKASKQNSRAQTPV